MTLFDFYFNTEVGGYFFIGLSILSAIGITYVFR